MSAAEVRGTTNARKRHFLERLFAEQKGRCFWCGFYMLPTRHYVPKTGRKTPHHLCTLDHRYPRGHPLRGTVRSGVTVNVAACWRCNGERGRAFERAKSKEELWASSGRPPQQRVAA